MALKTKLVFCAALILLSANLTACDNNEDETETSAETTSGLIQTADTTEETSATDETTTAETEDTVATPAVTDNLADELASIVLENAPFPMMVQYESDEELEQYTSISIPDDMIYSYYCQMMSVHLAEVLIIVADDDTIDQAFDIAKERAEKLMNDMAFYPTQQAAAEATVYGKKNNIAYVICVENAKDAEAALLDSIQ